MLTKDSTQHHYWHKLWDKLWQRGTADATAQSFRVKIFFPQQQMILHTLCQTICSAILTNTQPVWLGRQTLLRTLHQNIWRQLLQYMYDNISNIKRKISHPYGCAVTVITMSPASSTVTPRYNGPLYLIHPFASSARSTSSPLSRRMPFAVISMRKITPCGLNRPPHTTQWQHASVSCTRQWLEPTCVRVLDQEPRLCPSS